MPEEKLSKLRIGEILTQQGWLKDKELEDALEVQKGTGDLIGTILVEKGFVSQKDLYQAIAIQQKMPFVDFQKVTIPEETLCLIPKDMAFRFQFMPLIKKENTFLIAVGDPLNSRPAEEIRKVITDCEVRVALACPSELQEAFSHYYGG